LKIINNFMYHAGAFYKAGFIVYWSAGSDENCERTFGWCDIDVPFSKWIPWAENQPDNGGAPSGIGGENCATFEHSTYVMSSEVVTRFGDRLCDSKTYFICEVGRFINNSCFSIYL
jgi:hypothetical protein